MRLNSIHIVSAILITALGAGALLYPQWQGASDTKQRTASPSHLPNTGTDAIQIITAIKRQARGVSHAV